MKKNALRPLHTNIFMNLFHIARVSICLRLTLSRMINLRMKSKVYEYFLGVKTNVNKVSFPFVCKGLKQSFLASHKVTFSFFKKRTN